MTEPTKPDEAGMAFSGTLEALSAMLAFAESTGAVLLWREDERLPSPFLLLRVSGANEVRPAEGLYDAFIAGEFPGVQGHVLDPADDDLRRLMRGPDAPL